MNSLQVSRSKKTLSMTNYSFAKNNRTRVICKITFQSRDPFAFLYQFLRFEITGPDNGTVT